MAQVINSNIASLNAQRNLNSSQAGTNQALERLSSGLRINSAKDDAAGLAISTRFQSQINGLGVAIRNVGDGVSLAQTAEGALGSMTESMQRIRELALQSANGTNSADDRAALNSEAQQLISEVSRAGSETNFNGLNLLDGSFSSVFQVGANSGETIDVSIGKLTADTLGVSASSGVTSTATNESISTGTLTINGVAIGASRASDDTASTAGQSTSAIAKAAAINRVSTESGVSAIVDANTVAGSSITAAAATGTVTVNGTTIGIDTTGDGASTRAAVVTAINAQSSLTGVTAIDSGDDSQGVSLVADDGRNVALAYGGSLTSSNTGLAAAGTNTGGFTLVADAEVKTVTIGGSDAESAGLVSGSFSAGVATVSSTARSATAGAAATVAVSTAGTTDLSAIAFDFSQGTQAEYATITGTTALSATGADFSPVQTAAITAGSIDVSVLSQNFTDNAVAAQVKGGTDIASTGTDFSGVGDDLAFNFTVVDDQNYAVVINGDFRDVSNGGTLGDGNAALLANIQGQISAGYTATLEDGSGGVGFKLTITQNVPSAQTASISAGYAGSDSDAFFGFTAAGSTDYSTGAADTAEGTFQVTVDGGGATTITLDGDYTDASNGGLAGDGSAALLAKVNGDLGGIATASLDGAGLLVITSATAGAAGSVAVTAASATGSLAGGAVLGVVDASDTGAAAADLNFNITTTAGGVENVVVSGDFTDAANGGTLGDGNTALLTAINASISGSGFTATIDATSSQLSFTETANSGATITIANNGGGVNAETTLGFAGVGLTDTGVVEAGSTNATFEVYVDGGLVQNVNVETSIVDSTGLLSAIQNQVAGATASLNATTGFLEFTSSTTGATSSVQIANVAGNSLAELGLVANTGVGSAATVASFADLDAGDLVINGTSISAAKATDDTASFSGAASSSKEASGISVAAAINSASGTTGVTASVNATTVKSTTAATAGTEGQTGTLYLNGVDIALSVQDSADNNRTAAASAINAVTGQTGVVAEDNGTSLTLTAADGRNVVMALDTQGGAAAANFGLTGVSESDFSDGGNTGATRANVDASTTYSTVTLKSAGAINVSGGANGNAAIAELGLEKGVFGGAESGQFLNEIDISTQEGANAALKAIDNALNAVNSSRADLGAIQNRFEATISNLALTSENLSAANSRIKDADFASEAAALSRSQVLQQAGISILSQANAAPQQVLSLLQ
jgi:flagellin